MIKLFQCVRKKPGLSVQEFRRSWDEYGERLREGLVPLGARRIVLGTALHGEPNERLRRERGSLEPFDGIAEIWWDRGWELWQAAQREDVRSQIAALRRWQETFVDAESSGFFFASEEVVQDDAGV